LEKLEYNTLINYGFITEQISSVPDPESEYKKKPIKIKTKFVEPPPHKRKLIDDTSDPHNNSLYKNKKQKLNEKSSESTNELCPEPTTLFSSGCRWDSLNWSCAYDSVFMSLYSIFACHTSPFHHNFSISSPIAKKLEVSFMNILNSSSKNCTIFDHHRNNLRDELHTQNPNQFRRFGQHGTSASDILEIIFPTNIRHLITTASCPNQCHQSLPSHNRHTTIIPSQVIDRNSIIPRNLNEYMSNFIDNINQPSNAMDIFCDICQTSTLTYTPLLINAPPILFFELPMESTSSLCTILPSWNIKILLLLEPFQYQLSAIIYLGGFHFTIRLIHKNGSVWKHNGATNNGIPILDFIAQKTDSELEQLLTLEQRKAHIYIYSRVNS